MELPDKEFFSLLQQAGYWRAQHGRAAQRVCALESNVADFEGMVRALKASLVESAKEKDVLKARIAWLERQLFGAKGEQSKDDGGGSATGAPSVGSANPPPQAVSARLHMPGRAGHHHGAGSPEAFS